MYPPTFGIVGIEETNTIHQISFGFFLIFFHHSSCRKDQFTVLILKLGHKILLIQVYSRDPAEPRWFVIVVLP